MAGPTRIWIISTFVYLRAEELLGLQFSQGRHSQSYALKWLEVIANKQKEGCDAMTPRSLSPAWRSASVIEDI